MADRPAEVKKVYQELAKKTGVPEDQVGKICDELGMADLDQIAGGLASYRYLDLVSLRRAFRISASVVAM